MAVPLALPTTLPAAESLAGTLKEALPALTVMLVNGGIKILLAVLILIIGWSLSRWLASWLGRVMSRGHHVNATFKPLIASFVRYAVLLITLVAVLDQFGVQTTSLIALVGAAGIAVGLALQGTLSNVASGVMLLVLRPFQVGEKITGASYSGTVEEIGLFQTILFTDDGVMVSVPNTTIFSGTITNETRKPLHRINVSFDVDYRADLKAAVAALRETLMRDARVLKSPAPVVQVSGLRGPAADIQTLAWASTPDAAGVQADYLARARAALLAIGVGPAQPLAPNSPDPSKPPAPKA